MFNLFSNRTAKDYLEESKEIYNMPNTKPEKQETQQELYRIGVRPDGMTTITMIESGGFSMTLSLNKAACEQMIKMIRATYPDAE